MRSERDLRPSPVAVEDHGARDIGATAAIAAARPVELRLSLLGGGAGLLGVDDAQDEGEGTEFGVHCCELWQIGQFERGCRG